jgi:hypothetical protein
MSSRVSAILRRVGERLGGIAGLAMNSDKPGRQNKREADFAQSGFPGNGFRSLGNWKGPRAASFTDEPLRHGPLNIATEHLRAKRARRLPMCCAGKSSPSRRMRHCIAQAAASA